MIAQAHNRAEEAQRQLDAEARELLYPVVPDLPITLPLLEARAARTYSTLSVPRRRELALRALELHRSGQGPAPAPAPLPQEPREAPDDEEEAEEAEELKADAVARYRYLLQQDTPAAEARRIVAREFPGVEVERPKPIRTESAAVAVEEEGPVVQKRPRRPRWTRPDAPQEPAEEGRKGKAQGQAPSTREEEAQAPERQAPASTTEEERAQVRAWVEAELRRDPRQTARELLQGARRALGVSLADLHNFRTVYVNPARDRLGIVWTRAAATPVEEIPEEDLISPREVTPKLRRQIRERIAALLEDEPELPGAEVHRIIRNEFRVDFRDVSYFRKRWVAPLRPEGAEPAAHPRNVVVLDPEPEAEERAELAPATPAPPPAPPAPDPAPAPVVAPVVAREPAAAGAGLHFLPGEGGRARVVLDFEADQGTALRLLGALSSILAGFPAAGQ